MVVTMQEVLGTRLYPDPKLIEWVDKREREVFAMLKEEVQPVTTDDLLSVTLKTLGTPAAGDASHPQHSFFAAAAQQLALRLQATGWDEAEVNFGGGTIRLKRFRRRVYVTVKDVVEEFSVPVYEHETEHQAARRIFAGGLAVARYGGLESGLLLINPLRIQHVRIPCYHTTH
jgi:hypothetical protein